MLVPLIFRRAFAAAVLALVAACGGRVVVDGGSGGGSSTSSGPKCAIGKCGDACQSCDEGGCEAGVCDVDVVCRTDGAMFECPDPCGGLACGATCDVCNQDGCDPSGHCAKARTCELGPVDCGPVDATCATLPCGAECATCGEIECFIGVCDQDQTCEPFNDVICAD